MKSMNGAEIFYFISEFNENLPFKVEKIYLSGKNQILFNLYSQKWRKITLLIEVRSEISRILLAESSNIVKISNPSGVQNLFRSIFLNSTIVSAEQIEGDRVVKIGFKRAGIVKYIVAELMGRRGNIYILDQNDQIEGSLLFDKNYTVGASYLPPEKNKKFTLELDFSEMGDDKFIKKYIKKEFEIQKYLKNRYFENLKKEVLSEIKKENNKLLKLKKDRVKLESYKDDYRYGELLKGVIYQLKKGMESVEVIDYFNYEDPNSKIVIKVDKKKGPKENMELFFKRYEKYKRGKDYIEKNIKIIEKNIDKYQKKLEKIENGDIEYKPETIIEEKKRKLEKQKHKEYRVFKNRKGFKILVGKGGADNDYLTFKIASGNDIWLHVHSYSGSHVVIKSPNKKIKVDIETIYEAGHLAILYSKAPKNDDVEVSYTFKKYVKKPPKAKPGAVIFTQEKRVYMKFNQKIIDNLEKE